jgi:hypothetical protein
MGALFDMRAIGWAGLVLVVASAIASGQDQCSLIVRVANANGYKPSGVWVKLNEGAAHVEIESTVDGEVRFCNLGITAVSVTVGQSECNQVIVRHIPLTWNGVRIVNVIYDHESCLVDPPHSPGCSVLLRFMDEQWKSIPEVQLDPPINKSKTARSDKYGRAMVRLQLDEKLHVTAKSPGYIPEKLEVKCDITVSEMVITLHKSN